MITKFNQTMKETKYKETSGLEDPSIRFNNSISYEIFKESSSPPKLESFPNIFQQIFEAEDKEKVQLLNQLSNEIQIKKPNLEPNTMEIIYKLLAHSNSEVRNASIKVMRKAVKYVSPLIDFIILKEIHCNLFQDIEDLNILRFFVYLSKNSIICRNFLLEKGILLKIPDFYKKGANYVAPLSRLIGSFISENVDFEKYGKAISQLFPMMVIHLDIADAKGAYYIVSSLFRFFKFDRSFLFFFMENFDITHFLDFPSADNLYISLLLDLFTFILQTSSSNPSTDNQPYEIQWINSNHLLTYAMNQLKIHDIDVQNSSVNFVSSLIFVQPESIEVVYEANFPKTLALIFGSRNLPTFFKCTIIHFYVIIMAFASPDLFSKLKEIGIFQFLLEHILDTSDQDIFFTLNSIKTCLMEGRTPENFSYFSFLESNADFQEWIQNILDSVDSEANQLAKQIFVFLHPKNGLNDQLDVSTQAHDHSKIKTL